jgi:hypothetical protein
MGGLLDYRDQSLILQAGSPWTCSTNQTNVFPSTKKPLSPVKILGEDSHAGQIAVSPDERRVYYVMHGKHWLRQQWQDTRAAFDKKIDVSLPMAQS